MKVNMQQMKIYSYWVMDIN